MYISIKLDEIPSFAARFREDPVRWQKFKSFEADVGKETAKDSRLSLLQEFVEIHFGSDARLGGMSHIDLMVAIRRKACEELGIPF